MVGHFTIDLRQMVYRRHSIVISAVLVLVCFAAAVRDHGSLTSEFSSDGGSEVCDEYDGCDIPDMSE